MFSPLMQFDNLIRKGVNHRRAQGYELARDKALEFFNATQRQRVRLAYEAHQNLLMWNGQIKPVGSMTTLRPISIEPKLELIPYSGV